MIHESSYGLDLDSKSNRYKYIRNAIMPNDEQRQHSKIETCFLETSFTFLDVAYKDGSQHCFGLALSTEKNLILFHTLNIGGSIDSRQDYT